MTDQPQHTDIETRSRIAMALGKEVWPADREQLLEVATANDADDKVLSLLSSLPAGTTFGNVQDVSRELGLVPDEHEGPGAD